MNVIGFSGALDGCSLPSAAPGLSPLFFHDAAAAFVQAGMLTFAIEEERLNRQKHSNAFPVSALRACLAHGGVPAGEIDRFAFFFEEDFFNVSLADACRDLGRSPPSSDVRSLLVERLSRSLEFECDPARLVFINHHRAHARSAFAGSGYDEALVLVIDGNGETASISIFRADYTGLNLLVTHSVPNSLGHFYRRATWLAGFRDFDEYKFMGLAPYGDPKRFRGAVDGLMRSESGGQYTLDFAGLDVFAAALGLDGSPVDDPVAVAADFAAAVQQGLERLTLHVLQPWARTTGLRNLCLAGGVAQNCVMNSHLAASGLFERVFAYPGAYDAGAAIGAALEASAGVNAGEENAAPTKKTRTGAGFNPFLGLACPAHHCIPKAFEPWSAFLTWTETDDPALTAARFLADGAIVGWVNGRSEFGPRALGARSILADPRPVANWSRINLAIKQRESFRPFAPACLETHADRYFEGPAAAETFGHMTFIATVRERYRDELGAVTHVDASARLQTVSPDWNPHFHALLEHFFALTGCPIVLNTSFNNNAEPIVQTPGDAVRTLLLTELDVLIVERWVVTKRANPFDHLHEMEARLNGWASVDRAISDGQEEVLVRRPPHYAVCVPEDLGDYLSAAEEAGWQPLAALLGDGDRLPRATVAALVRLWRSALIDVRHGG